MRTSALFQTVRLGVEDPDALRTFYLEKLGLAEEEPDRPGFRCHVGATQLEFSPAPSPPPQHFAFNIPRNQLEAAEAWLGERIDLVPNPDGGYVFPFPDWDAQALYAIDPGGNIVEWIARHAVENDVSGDFGADQMLEVSEVGVSTGNVAVLAATLRAGLVLRGYRPASEKFAAIGDERGLFVLVENGRPWFPTSTPAASAPADIEIAAEGREPTTFAPAGARLRVRRV